MTRLLPTLMFCGAALAYGTLGATAAPATNKAEKPQPVAPTLAEVSYGPHPENVLDFWRANGDGPRPLHVYIHGGGWRGGTKATKRSQMEPFLEKGISCASIHYRLTPDHPLPAPVHDAARAIQFLRSNADEWNLDPERIVLTGGSAGACTSMWLLFHDDLADPNAADRVLRQSTRVTAAAVRGGQTSIDPKQIVPWLGENVLKHLMIANAVGEPNAEAALANYDKHAALYCEFSAYNHVSKDDPPLFMSYGGDMTLPSKNPGHGIHHPVYGVKLKEKCDEMGVECHLVIPGVSESKIYPSANDFLFAKLLGP